MKLLICTQAVDKQDPVLGFFHRWIEEFAQHCEEVVVVAQRIGDYSLPANVKVYSLGKEKGLSRPAQAVHFFKLISKERNNYDSVLVHMSPEYVLAGGLLWRVFRKRIVLWYTHKDVSLRLRIATVLADRILTASKESFRLPSTKVRVMGHGIDTRFFIADTSVEREGFLLSVGRLMKTKRHDLALQAAKKMGKPLHIVGEGPERAHLEKIADEMGVETVFVGGVSQSRVRDEYRKAELLLHFSETGSLDKVVLEALACGLPIRTTDPALQFLESKDASYVAEHHSLSRLIPAILKELV